MSCDERANCERKRQRRDSQSVPSASEATNSISAPFVRASSERNREIHEGEGKRERQRNSQRIHGIVSTADPIDNGLISELDDDDVPRNRRDGRVDFYTRRRQYVENSFSSRSRRTATSLIDRRRAWCYVVVDGDPRDSSWPVTKSARVLRREEKKRATSECKRVYEKVRESVWKGKI